jgi:hypothetical protein
LQGREQVEWGRSKRRAQIPIERHAFVWEFSGVAFECDKRRFLVSRRLVPLNMPLWRQVFVGFIGYSNCGRAESNSPGIIGLSQKREKDQKKRVSFHRHCCPPDAAKTTMHAS